MKNEVYRETAGNLPLVIQTPLRRHMVSTRSVDDLLVEATDASTRQNTMKFGKEDYSSCTSLKKPMYDSTPANGGSISKISMSPLVRSPLFRKEQEF